MKAKIAPLQCWMTAVVALIFVLLPFHAFLTVWGASLFGHYTWLRLWKEFLVLVLLVMAAVQLVRKPVLRRELKRPVMLVAIGYLAVLLIWSLGANIYHQVGSKGVAYGLLSDGRFVVFFIICWLLAANGSRWLVRHYRQLLLWPGALVAGFATLQYVVLPTDFLRHFGYGSATIEPTETINHNARYIRVQSTLRGANPLGAYMVMVVSVVAALLTKQRRIWYYWLVGVLSVLALAFSFSRSAWIGAVVSVVIILAVSIKLRRAYLLVAAVALLVLVAAGWTLRHNLQFENALLHTDTQSTITSTSNGGHASALKQGVHDVLHEPLGRGVGSAGAASVYSGHPARIAENYYLQIGQETGWLGLVLFLALNIMTGILLWHRRRESLALWLFASLVGLSLINLLSHAWADDTLSYLWWGWAGLALGGPSTHD